MQMRKFVQARSCHLLVDVGPLDEGVKRFEHGVYTPGAVPLQQRQVTGIEMDGPGPERGERLEL